MKFSAGMDLLEKENRMLRMFVIIGLVSLGLMALTIIVLSQREPLIVVSSSRGLDYVKPVKLERSEADVRIAVELMLKARFNSDVTSPDLYLSDRQVEIRNSEQQELKSRNLKQAIVLRAVNFDKNKVSVDFDRVIAIQDVRSALRTQAKIEFQTEDPNELNPYGLKLSNLEIIDGKEAKK
jgi:hypothetical protein